MMNSKEILRKAGGILTELNEQYEYLSRNPENLNELELELFSANASFLSEHLSILVKLSDSTARAEAKHNLTDPSVDAGQPVAATATKKEEAVEASPEPAEAMPSEWKFELEEDPDLTFDFEAKETEKLFDRPLTEDEKKVIDEKTKLKEGAERMEESSGTADDVAMSDSEVNKEEDEDDVYVKEVVISERTIAVPSDQLRDENPKPTVNDLLSKALQQKTVSSQFNSRQTKDLKGMISLNDKLLFVRDLFNGYSLAYSEAIELLSRFDNFEAADNFLKQNYAAKNNWTEKQDVADKFYEILNRRFS